jgi:excisionase family DNA binding protein
MVKKQITVGEVEEIYGIPAWTVRKYIAQRRIPYRKVGRRVYIPVDKLEAWLSSGDVELTSGEKVTGLKAGE